MVDLGRISLRAQERGFVLGGVDTGKSTLAEALSVDFMARYPKARCMIVDTKPRFRAEWEVSGFSAKRRYRRWDHGPTVPGSVVIDDPAQLALAWQTGARWVIAQATEGRRQIPMVVACVAELFRTSRASQPSLVYVDETMDLFGVTGSPIGGDDAVIRVARSGRERGISGLYCSQRTRGIPATLMEELSKLYLLRVDFTKDLARLPEMGAPEAMARAMPTAERVFLYWTKAKYKQFYGPYTLALPRAPRAPRVA